jgi:hypothetical protein
VQIAANEIAGGFKTRFYTFFLEESRTHIVVRVLDGIAHQVLAEVLGGILDTTDGLQGMNKMGGEDPKKKPKTGQPKMRGVFSWVCGGTK